jgi:hypothetical protein
MSIEDDKRRSQFKISMYAHAERNKLTAAELLVALAEEVHAITAHAISELDFNHEQPRDVLEAENARQEERIEDLERQCGDLYRDVQRVGKELDEACTQRDAAIGERDSLRHVHQQNAELRQQIHNMTMLLDNIGMHVMKGDPPLPEAYWAALVARHKGVPPKWSDIALSPGEFADWAFEEGLR